MAKEICISSTPHETRLAILEDDQLAEIYYERENEYTLAGSVYKGRVTRVLPGMQSAFVDIGLERDAFLYVTDFLEMEDQEDTDEVERAASQGDTVRISQHEPSGEPPQFVPPSQAPQITEGGRPGRNDGRGGRDRGRRGDGRRERTPVTDHDIAAQFLPQSQLNPGQFNSGQPNPGPFVSGQPNIGSESPSFVEAGGSVPDSVASATAQQDETDEQGVRRFRGRRRRRGGRGRDEVAGPVGSLVESAAAPEVEAADLGGELAGEEDFEETNATDLPPMDLEAAASRSGRTFPSAPQAREERGGGSRGGSPAPVPFVLPGESLSKYGASAPASPAPSRLVVTSLPPDTSDPLPERTVTKPSTLIEDEIVWDGKGLLPGESLARHRSAGPTPAAPVETKSAASAHVQVDAEPTGVFADTHGGEINPASHEAGTPAGNFEFTEELVPDAEEQFGEKFEEEFAEDDFLEDGLTDNLAGEQGVDETDEEYSSNSNRADQPAIAEDQRTDHASIYAEGGEETGHGSIEASPIVHGGLQHGAPGDEEADEAHGDASASHNVDPLPPSKFRLSSLFGGGRKKEEEPEPEPEHAPTPKSVSNVSAYAPGAGLLEEEVIDEEEYDFTPMKAQHGDEHDLEEIEEETMQNQIRSGALGEMVQEAHLDHRLLLESADDDDSEEDDAPAVAGGREGSGAAPGNRNGGRDRNDRGGDRSGGRGRRGRPGQMGSGSSSGSSSGGGTGVAVSGGDGRRPSRRASQMSDLPIISDLLKPGQEILVQIAKEPIAKKGARITSHIALPGRFLVFMPTVSHVGVSRKIASDEERQRLKRILVSEKGEASGGFIVRTAAEGATEEELRADLRFLINLWNDIKQRADSSKPPALIYHDLNLIERILRDQVSDNFSHIWVDSEADYERIVRFLNRFSPELVRRVKLYTKEVPLFEHFGIQDEISKALRSKVWLKSGGSIVINQTEALVAIDINTGKFVGKTARLEDTILKTNLDAIPEIVRQIRLRDLGGIIVIDFIDMDERKNRTRVMAALEEALKQDRAPTKVLQFNDFGLVAITRKRVKQSLERTLSVPCPVCQATGMVKSAATVANEIYVEIRKMRKHFDGSEVLLRVNPETAKALKSNNARWLTELEDLAGKNVLIKSDATLHPEQFDIQG